MANYVTEQVEEVFKEKQEWDSFLILCQNKDAIRNDWYSKLKSKVNEMVKDSIPSQWGFISWGIWDYRWFIKDFEKESLCLWFTGNSLRLWANGDFYDRKKIFDLLQESKYSLIKSAFDRIDDIFDSTHDWRFIENGNFYFGDPADGRLDTDKLMWYANYRTEEFAKQIIDKVNKFITNPEITRLFIEINEQSRK